MPGTPGGRPIKWVPTFPVDNPGGSQSGGSWDDEEGHWDVDNGRGERTRWLPDGTSVGVDHKPIPKPEAPPEPLTGLDVNPALLGAVVLGVLIIILIIVTDGAAAPALVRMSVVPAA